MGGRERPGDTRDAGEVTVARFRLLTWLYALAAACQLFVVISGAGNTGFGVALVIGFLALTAWHAVLWRRAARTADMGR